MRPADLTPVARDVMRLPASAGVIFFSILAAYLLSALPWSGQWMLARPDFVLVVLLFWSMHEPRAIGQGIAFALGLLMDVSDSMLLGQHALAYVALLFAAIALHRRILNFSLPAQSLQLFPLLVGADLITVGIRLLAGGELPPLGHFLGAAIGAALWIPLCVLLRLPRVPKTSPDL